MLSLVSVSANTRIGILLALRYARSIVFTRPAAARGLQRETIANLLSEVKNRNKLLEEINEYIVICKWLANKENFKTCY